MATEKKTKGKNIRFSDKAHKALASYCKKHGYQLGTYCEISSMERMRNELINQSVVSKLDTILK